MSKVEPSYKLKDRDFSPEMKNIDLFSAISYLTVTIPFDRAWSQEFKNVLLFVSIASYDEKSAAQGAKKGRFCMGILVILSLCPL